jgi:hypothetical protein
MFMVMLMLFVVWVAAGCGVFIFDGAVQLASLVGQTLPPKRTSSYTCQLSHRFFNFIIIT